MKNNIRFGIAIMAVSLSFSACRNDSKEAIQPATTTCDTTGVSYSKTIEPLITTNCKSCHNTNSALGGVNLDNYTDVKKFADAGSLYGSINHTPGYEKMPQGGTKLPDCTIARVKTWINQGSPNN